MNSNFAAIIFDLDGTLIDTERPDFEACQILYQEFGATLTMDHWAKTVVGHFDGYDILFNELISKHRNGLTQEALGQRLHQLWQTTLQNVSLMPGVAQLLPQLQQAGYPLAVATASDGNWAKRWLTHFKLNPYFQTIANSDHITHNKPAPDVYLFAAAQLGVHPKQCLVFEDSLPGLRSAKSAGMTAIAVPSPVTQTLDFSLADGIVQGLQTINLDWLHTFKKH